MFTFAVVLSPESMSVTIVLTVPFGPIPCLMKTESIRGTERFASALVWVVAGFGVIIWELLYLLQRLALVVCMVCMQLMSQGSPGKQILIWLTASVSRVVIFPTLSLRLVQPPQVPSPLMAVSNARQMLQSVIVRQDFRSGIQEYDIILIIRVPLAQSRRSTIMTRIYFLEQGLLSVSRRRDSQGGQLWSKRQHRAVTMKKLKNKLAKMMQGVIIEDMYESSSEQSPFTTMS